MSTIENAPVEELDSYKISITIKVNQVKKDTRNFVFLAPTNKTSQTHQQLLVLPKMALTLPFGLSPSALSSTVEVSSLRSITSTSFSERCNRLKESLGSGFRSKAVSTFKVNRS